MSGAVRPRSSSMQIRDRELSAEWLGPHAREEVVLGRRPQSPQATEASDVLEVQIRLRLEAPDEARRPLRRPRIEQQLTSHAQVDDRHGGADGQFVCRAACGTRFRGAQIDDQVLAAATQAQDPPIDEQGA